VHLSSITIKGFKSFPERTRLEFAPGVSVIVGPNGCGKSNITDAVLWALGEQSPLAVRGSTMQDMIFAGGDGESPRRHAEVEVVLSSEHPASDPAGADASAEQPAGFSEISVRRRLDRNGEGEYRLNGARCRLVDVIEALSDANLGHEMHSVISQGRVEEIVHSRPRERRLLVEEAAGLGKHRKRRRRAQLKLERTQDNLDRALDVEREARSRLRPLKRQAQAADIHARLEREGAELRGRLLASELYAHHAELGGAERAAGQAREGRQAVEAELAKLAARRTEIEESLAQRDRERTAEWGRLTALRAAHERLSVRAEALAGRRGELVGDLDRQRAALGALAEDATSAAGDSADPVGSGLDRIAAALDDARRALEDAKAASGDGDRANEVARVREAAERAAVSARRVEGLLGRRRQDSLEGRIVAMTAIGERIDALLEVAAATRDAAGERATAIERRMLDRGDAEDVTAQLRECSQAEAALQSRLHSTGEAVTDAEVKAAHLRDRRDEAAAELERIGALLGREVEPATEGLGDQEREEIERKLERLARRREALGPVNPLAEREYAEAVEHVDQLAEQRTDLEAALADLDGLIADTDRKITSAFEATFEATQRNFEELIEHLFPGGRGRLRLVDERSPRLVLGGESDDESAEDRTDGDPAAPGRVRASGSDHRSPSAPWEDAAGVEIEVTPAGKATRKLSLLSGGEKALVALAFVFAVFLARPSPFYILDEVEAALDDANIDRFLQLVRRFSQRAQFVIVTHQKRTMDAADVLYGVSMGKGGVTKVISRRLSHADEAAEADESTAAAA
jgi:chromosome segregation ATPase